MLYFRILSMAATAAWLILSLAQLLELPEWGLRTPKWDEAAHIMDAIYFAEAFKSFSLGDLFNQLNHSGYWPPLIPLTLSPSALLFGYSYLTLRTTTFFLAAVCVAATFWAASPLKTNRSNWVTPLISCGFLVLAPPFWELSITVLNEVPTLVTVMISLGFYLRYLETEDSKYIKWAFISLSLAFFSKYNAAILIGVPMICHLVAEKKKVWVFTLRMVHKLLKKLTQVKPLLIFLIFYFTAAGIILWLGGINTTLWGQKILFTKLIGNSIYLPIFLSVMYLLMKKQHILTETWQDLSTGPREIRYLTYCFAIPVCTWLAVPQFFKTFLLFIFNESTRKQPLFSFETLSFYPKLIFSEFSIHPLIGWILIALFSLQLLTTNKGMKSRFMLLATGFNFFAIIIHPNHGNRYFFFTYGLLCVGAGLGFNALLHRINLQNRYLWLHILLASAVAIFTASNIPSTAAFRKILIKSTSEQRYRELAIALCSGISKKEHNAAVGLNNQLSPSLIAWECMQQNPNVKRTQLPSSFVHLGFYGYKSANDIIKSRKIDQYFVLVPQGSSVIDSIIDPNLTKEMWSLLPESKDYLRLEALFDAPDWFRLDHYIRHEQNTANRHN